MVAPGSRALTVAVLRRRRRRQGRRRERDRRRLRRSENDGGSSAAFGSEDQYLDTTTTETTKAKKMNEKKLLRSLEKVNKLLGIRTGQTDQRVLWLLRMYDTPFSISLKCLLLPPPNQHHGHDEAVWDPSIDRNGIVLPRDSSMLHRMELNFSSSSPLVDFQQHLHTQTFIAAFIEISRHGGDHPPPATFRASLSWSCHANESVQGGIRRVWRIIISYL